MGETQQSIDTNVNNLCTRCCKAKSKTEFGEYEMHVYDKELGRTQQVMVTYKSCARCREKTNKYKEEKVQQKADKETEQVCSRCLKIKPKSDYGEYKTWAFTKDTNPVQEVFLPYKSCKGCRDKENYTIKSEGLEAIQVMMTQVIPTVVIVINVYMMQVITKLGLVTCKNISISIHNTYLYFFVLFGWLNFILKKTINI